MSVEKDWDSYLKSLEKYDVNTYISLYQKAYDSYTANN